MSSRALLDALSRNEWKTNSFYRRQQTNSSAKRKSVMKFCQSAMPAIHSHARITPNVWWNRRNNTSADVLQAIMVNTANTWLTLATEIRAEITEHARFWKKDDSVANASQDTKVAVVKSILTTATSTSAKTMVHVLMELSRIHAVVCPALLASFARRKFNSAEPNSTRVLTAPNALTISHITHANVHSVSVGLIVLKTLTTAKVTCVRTAELALTASTTTYANVQLNSPENSAKEHQWLQWCTRKHRLAKIMNANLVSASNRIHRRLTTFASALQATQESAANI
jgi:hypothetical protein